jgi:hypothetical protein
MTTSRGFVAIGEPQWPTPTKRESAAFKGVVIDKFPQA